MSADHSHPVELVAPARRPFTYAHRLDGNRTRCGLDTTDPAEIWQHVPPRLADRVCPDCTSPSEDLTLL